MSTLTTLVSALMNLVQKLGYFGIFTVIGLEYACFPIPSEVVLPFVGMSIPASSLEFLPSFLVSILAGLTGSLFCYALGAYGGQTLLNKWALRSSGLANALDTFNHWFSRYGRTAVLFSRIIPLTRTYISLFAGASHMSLLDFILYSSVGIAAWNLVLMSLGFYMGNNWELIETILNTYSNIVLALLAIAFLSMIVYKWVIPKVFKKS